MRSWITALVAVVAFFLVAADLGNDRNLRAEGSGYGCGGSAVVTGWTPLRNIRARRASRVEYRRSAASYGCGGVEVEAAASCSGTFDPLTVARPIRTIVAAPVRVLRCVGGSCSF